MGNHIRNVISSSIVRTRVMEFCETNRIDIANAVWSFEPTHVNMTAPTLDKIYSDARTVFKGDVEGVNRTFNLYTKSGKYTNANEYSAHKLFALSEDDVLKVIKRSYDGIVGKGPYAYSNEQRSLVISPDPDSFNEKARCRNLNKRDSVLASKYSMIVRSTTTAFDASRFQGKMMARVGSEYTGDAEHSYNKARIVAAFAKSADIGQSTVVDLFSDRITIGEIINVNARIAELKPSLGWIPEVFAQHAMEEYKYIEEDTVAIRERIFAIYAADVNEAPNTRITKWTPATAKIDAPAAETAKPTGMLASLFARAKNKDVDAHDDDFLARISQNDDDDDECPGII
jgi:hypothetical protein